MNNPPSRLGSVVEGLAGCEFVDCSPDTLYSTLEVDSRKVGPGTVFVAVRGATFDAHDYIEQVARAGAVAVIAQRGACARPPGPHVWIDSTSASLATIAARHFGHPARQTALVGITGTNGKTTCTHLVSSILAEHKRLHFRLGTTGNWIVDHESKAAYTTPPPLELQALIAQAVRNGAHHGVMEVSSHALIQGRVDTLAFRAIGLTSFSQDHLDFHTNLTDYLAAKCKLATHHLDFTGSEPPLAVAHAGDGPNARAFLDQARRHGARTVLCSRAGVAAHSIEAAGDHTHDLHAETWCDGPDGLEATLRIGTSLVELRSPLVGDYNLDNLMMSVALSRGLGIDTDTIIRALSHATGAPGRLEKVHPPVGACTPAPRVLVDYAHTPDAVDRALAVSRHSTQGHLWVVLGCGGDRDRAKRPLMARAALRHADRLFATSDNPRTEDPEAILDEMLAGIGNDARVVRESDRERAIFAAICQAGAQDTILIAGKGHEDYQIIGTRRLDFDDRQVARRALASRCPPDESALP